MNIREKLSAIQSELKVPKTQWNDFGKYNYRSCEDILEAVKPLCVKYKCILKVFDEVAMLGNRFYVKATAQLKDCESGEAEEGYGFAREEDTKKGMDGSQITGASSSYARKYALNGLFCLDDTKDADSTNKDEERQETAPKTKKSKFAMLSEMVKGTNITMNQVADWIIKKYGSVQINNLTEEQFQEVYRGVQKKING